MLEGRLGELLSELQSRSVIESQNSSPQQDTGVNGADHRQTRFTSVTPTSPSANLATSLEATLDTALDTHVNDISRSEVNGGAHFDTHMIESSSAVIQDRPQFDSAGTNLASAPVPVLPETEQLNLHSTTCLERFRSFMLPYFPFLQLAPDLTFAQLRQDRPLLLQAIFCVAWPVAQEKPALARMLKLAFSEAAFLDYAKNSRSSVDATVDLLLALMTYIAWGWDHVYNRGSLSRLTMLCLSLVGELLLDRPKPQEPHTGHLLTPMSQRRYTESSASVFEHRRAALGCFVLSSIVSGYFSDMDAMKWTPQLEEILTTLDTNERSTADKDLVLQVRLELLRAKAGHLRSLLQKHPNQAQEPQKPAAEVFSDAETLLADLQKLRRTSYTCSQHLQRKHHSQ